MEFWLEIVYLSCISETVICKMLRLGKSFGCVGIDIECKNIPILAIIRGVILFAR